MSCFLPVRWTCPGVGLASDSKSARSPLLEGLGFETGDWCSGLRGPGFRATSWACQTHTCLSSSTRTGAAFCLAAHSPSSNLVGAPGRNSGRALSDAAGRSRRGHALDSEAKGLDGCSANVPSGAISRMLCSFGDWRETDPDQYRLPGQVTRVSRADCDSGPSLVPRAWVCRHQRQRVLESNCCWTTLMPQSRRPSVTMRCQPTKV